MIKTYKILYVLRLKVLQLILRQSFITPYFCFAFSLMGSLGEKRTNKNYTMQYITLMSRVTKKTLFEISTLKTTFEVSIRKDMNFAFSSKYTKLLNIALNKQKKPPKNRKRTHNEIDDRYLQVSFNTNMHKTKSFSFIWTAQTRLWTCKLIVSTCQMIMSTCQKDSRSYYLISLLATVTESGSTHPTSFGGV